MRFSQRINKKPFKKEIQIETMDDDLRNGLWNIIKMSIIDNLKKTNYRGETEFNSFSKMLWHEFYKKSIDSIPYDYHDTEIEIRNNFFKYNWFEVYDFVEYIIQVYPDDHTLGNFKVNLNGILEKESSGYRIINNIVAPISNQIEFDEVNETLSKTQYLTALNGANIHLSNSIELISNKKNPNYRNSVKESISAVESTCRLITGENTLGSALNKLQKKGININKQLKAGFEKIYAYTNNKESGIRHAIVTEPVEPDFTDAKYMLIACSSFINFLIAKAEKFGVKIE